jgi:hypothetical protein
MYWSNPNLETVILMLPPQNKKTTPITLEVRKIALHMGARSGLRALTKTSRDSRSTLSR